MPLNPPINPTPLAELSPAPTMQDPENFPERGDVHVAEVVAMVPQLNAALANVFANASIAFEGGRLAEATQGLAAYKGPWSTLAGALAIPATVTHGASNTIYMLLQSVANVAAETPGVSNKWLALGPSLKRAARTVNTSLAAGDCGSWIDITSGTFTQTFAACSALGAGWWCYLGNSGAGDITLDPNGSEAIDGLLSYVMYPTEVRLLHCDGATLRSFVISSFSKTFLASGTFVRPPGYQNFGVVVIGGGGGGQCGARVSTAMTAVGGNSGAGGGIGRMTASASMIGASPAITVGAGGLGAPGLAANGAPVNGSAGGTSSIQNLLSASGGSAAGPGTCFAPGLFGFGAPSSPGASANVPGSPGQGLDGNQWFYALPSGGGGGACFNGATYTAGGAGGQRGVPSGSGAPGGTAAGAVGAVGGSNLLIGGAGGGGGAGSAASGNGGNGGAGGTGAGGGGGGGSNGGTSGKGGNGGAGAVTIWGVI